MRAASSLVLALVLVVAGCASSTPPPTCPPAAAAPPPAGAPSLADDWRAPLERLVGDWTFEGTAAGEPVTWEETCRWIPESTFLACKTPGEASTTVMGFEPHTGRYAHYGIGGKGAVNVVRGGTMEGETWRFASDRERVRLTFTPSGFDFVSERPGPDGAWAPALTGRFIRRSR